MKKVERFIWISVVFAILSVSLFGIYVRPAKAGNITSTYPYLKKMIRVLNIVEREYVDQDKVDVKVLINGAIKGMLEALGDPHTNYLSEEEWEDMTTTSSGTFGGVGMIISEKDDYIVVVTPIEDTPAYRKGMKSGDLIITVDGESIKGISVSDAAKKLRGTPGSKVKVEFLRDEVKYEVEIVRAIIDVPTVKHDIIDNKYGYLRITQFAGTTKQHVKKALNDFEDGEVQAIIVDLRYNPGGLLQQVIEIVDFFVDDDQVIVSTKGRRFYDEATYKANSFNTLVESEIPVIVLVDDGSASASEIFAGAIKDLERGILIGDKTYGKGSVQTIHQLGEDGFKLTIAKYYTPSGICIDGLGIEPHIAIKEPELTEQEKESLKKFYKNEELDKFLEGNEDPSDEEIAGFIARLKGNGYIISDRFIKTLVNRAAARTNGERPIFDINNDIQLNKAVEVLDSGKLLYDSKKGTYSLEK